MAHKPAARLIVVLIAGLAILAGALLLYRNVGSRLEAAAPAAVPAAVTAARDERPSPTLQALSPEEEEYAAALWRIHNEVKLAAIHGVGVTIPPPYLEPRWQTLPRPVRSALKTVDGWVAGWPPFNRVGDHVLLRFLKDPAYA